MNIVRRIRSIFTPETHPDIAYQDFHLQRFRAIRDARISFKKSETALLLGLNESGKTTLLKGIEAFDFRNDPKTAREKQAFLQSVRNKQAVNTNESAQITATITLDGEFNEKALRRYLVQSNVDRQVDDHQIKSCLGTLNEATDLKIRLVHHLFCNFGGCGKK